MLVSIKDLFRSIEKEWLLGIREDIRRLKHELKQLYDESQLKQVCISIISFFLEIILWLVGSLHITCCLCT